MRSQDYKPRILIIISKVRLPKPILLRLLIKASATGLQGLRSQMEQSGRKSGNHEKSF